MKNRIYYTVLLITLTLVSACTKEVKVAIPGFEEQLVVDGSIEPGQPPIVILTKSNNIYAPTNIETFLSSFVTDAEVFVSDGTTEHQLTLICSDNLPPGSENVIAGLLGLTPEQVNQFNICAFTSLNTAIWGQVGKNYTLKINYQGKEFTGTASILQPHALDSLWWKEENGNTGNGFTYGRIIDPIGIGDAYYWQVKRINKVNGVEIDPYYKATFSGVFNDEFIDGKPAETYFENPWNIDNKEIDKKQRGRFQIGDTVVVKFSKLDKGSYEFLYSKFAQAMSSGNPFASPMNIKTNMQGGCLGGWIAYSPTYDTVVCKIE